MDKEKPNNHRKRSNSNRRAVAQDFSVYSSMKNSSKSVKRKSLKE